MVKPTSAPGRGIWSRRTAFTDGLARPTETGTIDGYMTDAIAFHPSPPERAKTLSSEQIRRFNANGFVRPLDALTADQVDSARAYFESLLSRMQAMQDGRNTYALDGYHLRCRGIWEMALHPKILDYVEDLLGPDFVCWSTHYFCKMGGDRKTGALASGRHVLAGTPDEDRYRLARHRRRRRGATRRFDSSPAVIVSGPWNGARPKATSCSTRKSRMWNASVGPWDNVLKGGTGLDPTRARSSTDPNRTDRNGGAVDWHCATCHRVAAR